jgi:hypothetical protein
MAHFGTSRHIQAHSGTFRRIEELCSPRMTRLFEGAEHQPSLFTEALRF